MCLTPTGCHNFLTKKLLCFPLSSFSCVTVLSHYSRLPDSEWILSSILAAASHALIFLLSVFPFTVGSRRTIGLMYNKIGITVIPVRGLTGCEINLDFIASNQLYLKTIEIIRL